MKKSLKQLVLVGLSTALIVSVAPVSYAEESVADEEVSEVVEDPAEEASEEVSEEVSEEATETTTDEAEVEASEAQLAMEEAIRLIEEEYPEAEIEEVDISYDQDENHYEVEVHAFTAEEDLEFELLWQEGAVVESGFDQGWFPDLDGDTEVVDEEAIEDPSTDTVIDPATSPETNPTTEPEITDPTTDPTTGEDLDDAATEEVAEEAATDTTETTDPATDAEAPAEEERASLDLESLLTLDEASELALGEVEGTITEWNLTADTSDFWDFLTPEDESDEGPVWTIEVEATDAMMSDEVRIDATTGDIIDTPDEEAEESMEESAESVEESVEDAAEEAEESAE